MNKKKTVSVLGCCMSRNIFNSPQLSDIFEVKKFAFQVVPWSCFDASFHIPYERISEIVKVPFEQRILDYNLNKSVLQHFENEKTDYIVIDLIACSFVMYELVFDGKTTIARMGHGDKALDKMKNNKWFQAKGFSYKKMSWKDVSDKKVQEGIDKFIAWLDRVYHREQIIICCPSFPDKWINKELKLCDYDDKRKKQYAEDFIFVDKLTNYMIDKLKGCLIYEFPENMIAEEYAFKQSLPFHQTNMDYIRQGWELLRLLKIDYNDYYSKELEPVSYLLESWVSKYCDARKMLFDLENALLGGNAEVKDAFMGTSVSSVFTQPFGKNLMRVKDVVDRVEKQKVMAEKIWYDKYMKLRADYLKLQEQLTDEVIYDSYTKISMKEARGIAYNKDLLDVNQLIYDAKR